MCQYVSGLLSELDLFVLSLALPSAVSALKYTNFNGIVHGSSSFLMLCLGIVSDETIDRYFEEPAAFSSSHRFSFSSGFVGSYLPSVRPVDQEVG